MSTNSKLNVFPAFKAVGKCHVFGGLANRRAINCQPGVYYEFDLVSIFDSSHMYYRVQVPCDNGEKVYHVLEQGEFERCFAYVL